MCRSVVDPLIAFIKEAPESTDKRYKEVLVRLSLAIAPFLEEGCSFRLRNAQYCMAPSQGNILLTP